MTTLLRHELGEVLRDSRLRQGRTLREVSGQARVSLGYLSEVERGQKEASSELLASICAALGLPMSRVLHEVSQRLAMSEPTPGRLVGQVEAPAVRALHRTDVVVAA